MGRILSTDRRTALVRVGVADDARHRPAPAGDLAGFDPLAVAQAMIGRRRRPQLGTPDIEDRICLDGQAAGRAPNETIASANQLLISLYPLDSTNLLKGA